MKKYFLLALIYLFILALITSCGGGGGGGGAVSFSHSNQLHNGGDAGGWGNGNQTGGGMGGGSASTISAEGGTFTPCDDIDWTAITLTITVTSDDETTTHTFDSGEKDAIAELLTSLKKGDIVSVSVEIEMMDDVPRTSSAGPITVGIGDNHISIPTPYKFTCSPEIPSNMYADAYMDAGLTQPTLNASCSGATTGIYTVNDVASKIPVATAPGFKFDHWETSDGKIYTPGVSRGDVTLIPCFKPDYSCDYNDLASNILITNQQDFNDLMNTHADKDFSGKTITLDCNVSTSKMFSNTSDGFKGEFDGRNHTVQVSISTSEAYFGAELSGLFARNTTGNIHNLIAAGSVSGTGGSQGYAGGIVGRNEGGTITACANTASISGAAGEVGGIAGYNSGTISECYNTGTVRTSHNVQGNAGGITGYNNNNITDCYNTGAVYGYNSDSRTGGITGHSGSGGSSATISYCYSTFLPPVSIPWSYGMLAGTTTVGTTSADHFYYDDTRTLLGAGGGSLVSQTNISTLVDVNELTTDRPSIWQAGSPYPTLVNAPY